MGYDKLPSPRSLSIAQRSTARTQRRNANCTSTDLVGKLPVSRDVSSVGGALGGTVRCRPTVCGFVYFFIPSYFGSSVTKIELLPTWEMG